MDYWANYAMAAYLMQASFPLTDFEMQMIKLDEAAEQLKEATEVSCSKQTCKITCFNAEFQKLKTLL